MLTQEEMQHFDEDFKHFLIINGVKNEEWLEFNQNDIQKATALVELFSDQVLQIIYEKIKFVEFRSEDACMVFSCLPDKMELIALNRIDETLNLSTPASIHAALTEHIKGLTIFKSEKPYHQSREQEIHQLLEQGAVPSSIEFWNALNQIL